MTRRFQFSLRVAFVLLTALGVCLGIAVGPVQEQRRTIKAIEALGGTVYYDWQLRGRIHPIPDGPAWLRRIIGDDYFQAVERVALFRSNENTIKAIPYLKRLPKLKSVTLSMNADYQTVHAIELAIPGCSVYGAGP